MQALRASLWLTIFISCGLSDNWAAEPEVRFNLLTLPSSRQAEQRLALPARLNYERAPLRECMSQLSERFQFSYWIDRRVDVDLPITIEVGNGTLRECISRLAQACDADMGLVENVVTIARAEHLAAMQYAAVRLHNQLSLVQMAEHSAQGNQPDRKSDKNTNHKVDAEFKPLTWPKLTTPSELISLINQSWQVNLPIDMPHDLMNAGHLQPCTVSTQLSLLLGGFDRCAAGKRLSELRMLPMPKSGNWQAEYANNLVNAEQVTLIKDRFPEARLDKAGNNWTLVGPTAAHLWLLQPTVATGSNPGRNSRSNSSADPLSQQRFDISKQSDKPLGAILKNLSGQLGLNLQWDPGLPPSAPQTLVTIEAKRARLDEILSSLGTQAKLSITREGTRVTVKGN